MENPSNLPRAVQILSPVDHCFQLKLNDLESILNADDIKDRRIVVVSIAGAFRKGKSFLMNFFLKYLYAQYKKCDVSDWIGKNDSENANRVQIGFKSRGGRQPETTGIWIWSDIFTHDENLAIILLDTQGIFDNQSSVKDCTTIFALSTLLSSVQCFNLMQNIQEDDLQHLELFTNYGKLVLGQSNEKPFQQLIFVVRNWPHACETGYGWSGRNVIEEVLAENSDQTSEMQQLRSQIKSSFEEISAFLMPFPGTTVQQGGFTGDLQQIDPEFVKYIEELVPAIFAPDKLIVKKINGHELRARDFAKYLQSYTDIFNGDKLPEPKTVLMATAETSYLILQNECMNFYVDFMEETFDKTETYFDEMELKNIHQRALDGAMSKFDEKRKLGGKKMISKLQRQIKKDINDKFDVFTQKNQVKLEDFIKKAKWHNKNVITEIKTSLVKCVCEEINNTELNLTRSHLQTIFGTMQKTAMEQFEREKIGIDEISDEFREDLKHGLDRFGVILFEMWDVYSKSVGSYKNGLMKKINEFNRGYATEYELVNSHQKAQDKAMAQY
ncbi:atlastin-like [Sitodiplosis mosellana]|uniref:atlastin-like n=1 Tax=Sitodiplosis mosellana TaxID=263140 RepID=UPI0024443211|nr:atlastin-like [Sitodiplosis mosellana]